jgi:rfaE bifunctional protein kinase chain/domain/rfaE bifunctional protein nucleotidyltransferase chain/domain
MSPEIPASRKILTLDELQARRRAARAAGELVVHCHGCFDIVHPGHVRHLQHAARQGDVLLVSITGDGAMNKGDGRPLIPQELRAENLAALNCVDWVYIDESPTALDTLRRVQPDIYVKGREYESNRDPRFEAEREAVESGGGRVVFTSGDVVFSSTALIAALEESLGPAQAALRQLVARHDIRPEVVEPLIARFRGKRIAVVGETIVDTYVMCDRPAVSGESPVMTLRPVDRRSFDGGAAIIARHLAAMGADPVLVTAHPRTPDAAAIRERLAVEGVETLWLDVDAPLVEKQRFLVGQQKVMKVDLAAPSALDARQTSRLVSLVGEAARGCHGAIVADYGGGLLTADSTRRVCQTLRPLVEVLVGDVSGRRSNLLEMQGVDLLCPSESEMRDALHDYDGGVSAVVWTMLERTQARNAIVTMGPDGLVAFSRQPDAGADPGVWRSRLDSEPVPALTQHAIDTLGCGDSLMAAATLALASGASIGLAATLGGLAAAAQARRLGNVVIGADDLRKGVRRLHAAHLSIEREPATARLVV